MATKAEQLVAYLLKEFGNPTSVKNFSNELRELGICDLKKESDIEAMALENGTYLHSLVTFHMFGLTSRLLRIKKEIEKFKQTKETK